VGVAPSACVVFEDAIAGIEAAINGGMKTVGIGSLETLTRADIVVSGLDKMSLRDIGGFVIIQSANKRLYN
jgi:beta-phosphoglucomutase